MRYEINQNIDEIKKNTLLYSCINTATAYKYPTFQDLSVFMVNNADDMDKLMTMGNRNRSIGATNMNALSSRSHAIFSITVECSEKSLGNYSDHI